MTSVLAALLALAGTGLALPPAITPLIDGAEFSAATLDVIAQATSSIELEMYVLADRTLAEALAARARQGIAVRVLLDPSGTGRITEAAPPLARQLAAAGAVVRNYPTHRLRPSLLRIDHVKLLIADGRRAVAGGSNWSKASLASRDFNVLLEGDCVKDLSLVFEQAWALSIGRPQPQRASSPADPRVVALVTDPQRKETLAAILREIAASTSSIRVAQYLLNEDSVLNALIAAHRRGVAVKVLLDHKSRHLGGVNPGSARLLQSAGIKVRRFHDPAGGRLRLHAKAGIFDQRRVILGSANWTRKALHVHHELAILIDEPSVAGAYAAAFDADWQERSASMKRYWGPAWLLQKLAQAIAGRLS